MSRKQLYHHRISFNTNAEAVEHIKWCRRNLGFRGTDWDFSGATNIDILIYNEKYIPFYKLIYE